MIEWLGGLKVAKAIPGFARWAESRLERKRKADLARDLAKLAFWSDGLLGPLRSIANGQGDALEVERLQSLLQQTDEETGQAAKRLKVARGGFVSTEVGMPVARALDKVIDRKMGRGEVRDQIRALSKRDPKSSDVQQRAQWLVSEIEDFNNALDNVHEKIRPKTNVEGAKAKKEAL